MPNWAAASGLQGLEGRIFGSAKNMKTALTGIPGKSRV
jgi:hypothetical protein